MDKNLTTKEQIIKIKAEIDFLKSELADKVYKLVGNTTARVLPVNTKEQLDKLTNSYAKKIAHLTLDLKDLGVDDE